MWMICLIGKAIVEKTNNYIEIIKFNKFLEWVNNSKTISK
jgi:hypothetical protein